MIRAKSIYTCTPSGVETLHVLHGHALVLSRRQALGFDVEGYITMPVKKKLAYGGFET
jgi:hypothetical protein